MASRWYHDFELIIAWGCGKAGILNELWVDFKMYIENESILYHNSESQAIAIDTVLLKVKR